jgi:hypothetical protein
MDQLSKNDATQVVLKARIELHQQRAQLWFDRFNDPEYKGDDKEACQALFNYHKHAAVRLCFTLQEIAN